MAAVSYDKPELLQFFANKRKIRFPLLSDAESKVIRDFGILNEGAKAGTPFFGIPHPVTFVVDRGGVVKTKFFEEDYRQRQTLAGILAKDYGVVPGAARGTAAAKHVRITTSASTSQVRGGHKMLLALEVDVPKGFHIYAPGVEGYTPVSWTMPESPVVKAEDAKFPKSRILFLQAIDEKVPVYEGKVRIVRDVTLGQDKEVLAATGDSGALTLEGSVRYQACSETLCYPPETVPVKWQLRYEAHDRERAPQQLRRSGM